MPLQMVSRVGFKFHLYPTHPFLPITKILFNFISIVYSLFYHHEKVLHMQYPVNEKPSRSYVVRATYFAWKFLEVVSRVQILILLMAVNCLHFILLIIGHSIFMYLFLRLYQFKKYHSIVSEINGFQKFFLDHRYYYYSIMSFFTYSVPFILPTREERKFFYSILFLETLYVAVITKLFARVTIPFFPILLTYLAVLIFMKLNSKHENQPAVTDEWFSSKGKICQISREITFNAYRTSINRIKDRVDDLIDFFDLFFHLLRKSEQKEEIDRFFTLRGVTKRRHQIEYAIFRLKLETEETGECLQVTLEGLQEIRNYIEDRKFLFINVSYDVVVEYGELADKRPQLSHKLSAISDQVKLFQGFLDNNLTPQTKESVNSLKIFLQNFELEVKEQLNNLIKMLSSLEDQVNLYSLYSNETAWKKNLIANKIKPA